MMGRLFDRRMSYSVMAMTGLLAAGVYAQTISKMSVVGKYQRPGTVDASGGIWGWTSPVTGKEYALMTTQNPGGLCVIDLSDPTKPALNTFISAGHNSLWFEVNGFRNYAYVVSQEGSMGLMIIDLSPLNTGLPARLVTNNTQLFQTAHTIYVDSTVTPARLYATYSGASGVQILSLADPAKPVEMAKLGGETHDMYARGNFMYRSTQRRGTLEIWNVATPSASTRVSTTDLAAKSRELGEIPAGGSTITHNAWLSEDSKILFTSEETQGTSVKSWNIEDPTRPRYLGKYIGVNNVIAHNVYVKGSKLYAAHYTAGLRIVDIADPANMKEIAFHRPSTSTALYAGCWGCYPWFKSGNIIYGDMQLGLFVMRDETVSTFKLGQNSDGKLDVVGTNNGSLQFRLPVAGDYALSVFSATGLEIYNHRAPGTSGMQTLTLDNGKLAKGNYLVRLRQDSRTFSSPIVLKN